MKKIGKILTGLLIVLSAVALREMISTFLIVIYIIYGSMSGKTEIKDAAFAAQSMLQNTENVLFISAIATATWILVFGLIYKSFRRAQGKGLFEGTIKAPRIIYLAIMGLSLQLSINSILGLLWRFAPGFMEDYKQVIQTLGMGNSMISLLFVVIIAPIGEELVFRGVVQNYMKRHVKFITANIMQAIFFGIYHMNIVQAIYAFLLGLLLGWIADQYGSVREAILLHMAVNLSGCVVGYIVPQVFFSALWGQILLFGIAMVLLLFSLKRVKNEIKHLPKDAHNAPTVKF